MSRTIIALSFSILTAISASSAVADDWPQWMGPQRDNVWRETGLLDAFPEAGPPVAWRTEVGAGYAGPAVAGGRVYITDFVTDESLNVDNFARKEFDGTERVRCLDERTGKELWKHEYPTTYTMSYPAGPRCTPVIDEGRVYALGGEGQLTCLDAASGKVLWEKNFQRDFNAPSPLWGFAAHPLVDGPRLICVVGGEGSHVVAFNKETGDEIWRALTSPAQGYSPPTIIEAGGVRQLVLARPDAVSAVDPETGAELPWSFPYKADNDCVILSPVFANGYLYVGGFQGKSLCLKMYADKPDAELAWANKGQGAISAINVQPFAADGALYGVDQSGNLRGIDLAAGEQLWETPQPMGRRALPSGTAFIVRQGDRYWMFTEAGELVIARLTREGYEELDRAKVIEPTGLAHGRDVVWSMPAFAGRSAFIRNDKEIIRVILAADAETAAVTNNGVTK
jgi:outer membrane protein assembly factor BamB